MCIKATVAQLAQVHSYFKKVISCWEIGGSKEMRRVFLSFQMEDKKQVDGVRLMKWNKNYPLEFYDESVRVSYKSSDAAYIRRKISSKIARCSATVCFLGKTTYQSSWVNWELKTSLENKNDVLLMGLPDGPSHLQLPEVVSSEGWWLWDPQRLQQFASS